MNSQASVPDFHSNLYPKCDPGPAPSPLDPSSAAVAKLDFLAAYQRINQSYRRLLTARSQNTGSDEERAALQSIEQALLARDALEDKYAAVGIVATPEFVQGYVTSVSFLHPPRPAAGSSLAMLFAVQPTAAPPA